MLRVAAATLCAATAFAADFGRDIEPLLKTRCQSCHGAAQQASGLRLDMRADALKGGYSGPVILPGKSAESKLMHRVMGAKGVLAMPPAGPRLTTAEIALLREWIDAGAVWPETAGAPVSAASPAKVHWAFEPIHKPQPPQPAANPIDAFILARLAKEKIEPSPQADKGTLLRRVHLDLTGLPPTPEEVAQFLADSDPGAYERVVDRLLASPHFGERWARPWLDRARYADSDGYEKDWARPYAWRYRQWVIEALNRDMPFDRFSVAQIAGDLMPQASVEDRVATGFHRNTLTNREGGIDNQQFRFEKAVDRVNTVSAAWLGLTVGCAQCHDHKYDPVTQKDYYQLFSFFENIEEADIDAPLPGEMEPFRKTRAAYRAEREALLKEYGVPGLQPQWETSMLEASANPGKKTDWDLAWDCLLKLTEGGDGEKIMRIPPAERTERQQDVLTDHFVRNYHFAVGPKRYEEVKFKELDQKLRALYERYPQLTQAMAVAEAQEHGASHHLRVRGDYRTMGIEVQPDIPAVLGHLETKGRASRLDLARWVVSKQNPLTPRVTVNWVWQELFGRGLVKSADDFGTRGEQPTHPELMNWLASQFVEDGWSMKALIRRVVTSSTYRQSSHVRPELDAKDPDNRLLARQERLRLPAELIRDAALFAGGLLNAKQIGGPSVRPPQPAGVAALGYGRKDDSWKVSEGADQYRRGLYIQFQRSTPYPFLINFDAPRSMVAQCSREQSTTPLQALNLLNDPVFFESAEALSRRIAGEEDAGRRLTLAYLHVLGRKPSASEARRADQYVERTASWTGLCSALLNLDEFITRE